MLHVVGARELFALVIHDDDFVAVTLVAKEFELATHPCIHQTVRQVLDAGRAELPLSSVHMVAKGDGDTMRLLLGLEERVQRIRTFNFAARHLIPWTVFGGCGICCPTFSTVNMSAAHTRASLCCTKKSSRRKRTLLRTPAIPVLSLRELEGFLKFRSMPNNRRFSKRSPGNAPPGAGPAASGGAGWEGISHSSEDSTESVPSKRCDADFEFSFHPCASSSSPAGSARARASPPLAVSSAPTHDSACVAPRCLRRRPSSAESQNLLLALQEREAGRLSGLRRSGPARQAILGKRGRLTYCLDELVSSDHPARESVILGFSGDGQSLISYAAHTNFNIAGAEHSDYALELWACVPPHQLRRHMCAPLFNCEQGGDFGASDLLEHGECLQLCAACAL